MPDRVPAGDTLVMVAGFRATQHVAEITSPYSLDDCRLDIRGVAPVDTGYPSTKPGIVDVDHISASADDCGTAIELGEMAVAALGMH